ncbi:hypothetical+protein [Methylocapsa aurea]|uniref:hypothetical protein n=1 Tax=Methylocapsa aurea TaxID=663610 RepID=UPI003D188507
MKLSNIKAASRAIESGDWVPSPSFPGVSYRVRGAGSVAARNMREQLILAVPAADRLNGLNKADADRVALETLVGAIWMDVKGLEGDNGKMIVYSVDKARELLSDPDCALLRADVETASLRVGNAQIAQVETDSKN